MQLFLGLVPGSLLQLIFPFLTRGIVDYGTSNQNLGVVTLILSALAEEAAVVECATIRKNNADPILFCEL